MSKVWEHIVDGALRHEFAPDDIAFFRENGFLVVRNLLREEERALLSGQSMHLIRQVQSCPANDDYYARPLHPGGEPVPFRVEYVLDKVPACRTLLAHPFLLRAIEQPRRNCRFAKMCRYSP